MASGLVWGWTPFDCDIMITYFRDSSPGSSLSSSKQGRGGEYVDICLACSLRSTCVVRTNEGHFVYYIMLFFPLILKHLFGFGISVYIHCSLRLTEAQAERIRHGSRRAQWRRFDERKWNEDTHIHRKCNLSVCLSKQKCVVHKADHCL